MVEESRLVDWPAWFTRTRRADHQQIMRPPAAVISVPLTPAPDRSHREDTAVAVDDAIF